MNHNNEHEGTNETVANVNKHKKAHQTQKQHTQQTVQRKHKQTCKPNRNKLCNSDIRMCKANLAGRTLENIEDKPIRRFVDTLKGPTADRKAGVRVYECFASEIVFVNT